MERAKAAAPELWARLPGGGREELSLGRAEGVSVRCAGFL